MYYLHIRELKGDGRREALPGGVSSIGRRPDNTIVLDQFGVSAHHAEIRVSGNQVVIRDLGSTNGTFVNGDRVDDARLTPGDRILVGSALAVLQEALSDRILLRVGIPPLGADADKHRPQAAPAALPEAGGEAPPTFEAIADLDDIALDDAHVFSLALDGLMRCTGARDGFLLGIEERGEYFLRAATGFDPPFEVDRGMLDEVVRTGKVRWASPGTGGGEQLSRVCLPLRSGWLVSGIAYLRLPQARARAFRDGAGPLGPALSAIAWIAARRDAEGALARVRAALSRGAVWPAGDPTTGLVDDDLLGHSGQILRVLLEIERAAALSSPVLLRGEPGVGVEQAAQRLHAASARQRDPFMRCICAAPSAEHVERDLFGAGHGAVAPLGKLMLARGGTLYLDEVADLPTQLQTRLASVLERDEPRPRSGEGPVEVDVRLVLATHLTLEEIEQRVEAGRFSRRLFEATRETRIRIPPLRERPEDIVPLAQHFMRRSAASMHKRVTALSSDVCRALMQHPWRGNSRELNAVIHRAVVLARDEILDLDVLPTDVATEAGGEVLHGLEPAMSMPWKEAKLAFERSYFHGVLQAAGGTVARASRHAGIARKNLYHKLKQHGLLPRDN